MSPPEAIYFRVGARPHTVTVYADLDAPLADVVPVLAAKTGWPQNVRLRDVYYVCGIRLLDPTAPLVSAGVKPESTIHAHLRLRGGGGDGGSTGAECRSAYLEMYAGPKPDAVDPGVAALARCTRCALSGAPLAAPVVADELGALYNKDAIVRGLLDKSLPPSLAHISSLKHVLPAVLTRIDAAARAAATAAAPRAGGAVDATAGAAFCCPVTGAPMNGRARFLLLRPSGVVVAEKALTVARAAVEEAAGGGAVDAATAVRLHPPPAELAERREALLAARAAAAAKKEKTKKRKKRADGDGDGDRDAAPKPADDDDDAARRRRTAAATLALAPEGADKKLYASLFTSSREAREETFAARGAYRTR